MTSPEQATSPYRSARGPRPTDAVHWQVKCDWVERWSPDRFAARVDLTRQLLLGASLGSLGCGILAALLVAGAGAFVGARDVLDAALPVAAAVALMAFVFMMKRRLDYPTLRIELDTLGMTALGKRNLSIAMKRLRQFEVKECEVSEQSSWVVHVACDDRTVSLDLPFSDHERAKSRAERLNAVLDLFRGRGALEDEASPPPDLSAPVISLVTRV